jgi:hypothetical protein
MTAADARECRPALTVTEPEDVVLVSVARAFDVWVEADAPTALGPHIHALRPDGSVIDPWFLTACLRSPENARQAGGHASSSSRIDVRRLHVLRLPLNEQRRYGEIYRKVVAFEREVQALGTEGERLRLTLTELLASGRLPRA